jgi:hypothetical protein
LVTGAKLPVNSVVIRREPDGHGVDREPVTPAVDQAERSLINSGAHLLPEAEATQERMLEAVRCSAVLCAAQEWCWVRREYGIDGNEGQPKFYCLAYQHAVKWVTVHCRERGEMTDAGFIQGQTRYLMPCSLKREVLGWGLWQRQLT